LSNSIETQLSFSPDELVLLRSALSIERNNAMISGSEESRAAINGMIERVQATMGDFPARARGGDTYVLADLLRAVQKASIVEITHPAPERLMPAVLVAVVDGRSFVMRPDIGEAEMSARAAAVAQLVHRCAPVECDVLQQTKMVLEIRTQVRPGYSLPEEAYAALASARLKPLLGDELASMCRVVGHDSFWSEKEDGVFTIATSVVVPVDKATRVAAAMSKATDDDEDLMSEFMPAASAPGP
jgi:hypothetical protein